MSHSERRCRSPTPAARGDGTSVGYRGSPSSGLPVPAYFVSLRQIRHLPPLQHAPDDGFRHRALPTRVPSPLLAGSYLEVFDVNADAVVGGKTDDHGALFAAEVGGVPHNTVLVRKNSRARSRASNNTVPCFRVGARSNSSRRPSSDTTGRPLALAETHASLPTPGRPHKSTSSGC